jgi:uncharacterized protein YkwD
MVRQFALIVSYCSATLLFAQGQDFSRVPAPDQPEAIRLFKVYREAAATTAKAEAMKALLNMHATVMLALVPVVERDWSQAITAYRAALQRQAQELGRKKGADPAFRKEVSTLQATLAKLRAKGGALTKEELQNQGMPALKRLRELFTIRMEEVVATLPALGPARERCVAFTVCRAALKAKTLLRDDRAYTEDDLKNEEQTIFARALRSNQRDDQILALNAEMIAKGAVPADEGEGIRDLNAMRILLGLSPVLIDPKLHIAARDHSKDMLEKNFFAHDSPVPGKKSPWDRAKKAGTSANAENIYFGSRSPAAANEAWFLSPGHHVNMFGNGRRGGMGRHEGHWTQMFGG